MFTTVVLHEWTTILCATITQKIKNITTYHITIIFQEAVVSLKQMIIHHILIGSTCDLFYKKL